MRARVLAAAVLVTAIAALLVGSAGAAGGSGPTSLGRTGWQVSRPYAPVHTASFPNHGNIGFYDYIPAPGVPGASDGSWSNCGSGNGICPSADTIGMSQSSRLGGSFGCLSSADFTFFQSLVSIPEGTTISQFSVNMSGADDGARVAIYNSAYPSGFIFAGSYIFLGGSQSTTDLSPYMVAGEVNRVVITQVDDCAVGNNLQFAQILLNGTVVPPKPPDTTPPVDAPVVSPAANGAGWNNSDVTVDWNWTDADSGIDPANCTQTSTSSGEGSITLTSTCKDLAGNSASDSRTVQVDETAPAIEPFALDAFANPVDVSLWSNQDIVVYFLCTDTGSGVASVTGPQTVSSDGIHTVSGTCVDQAGNSASTSIDVKIDKTAPSAAPVASPAANGAGWNGSDVTVQWNWSDGGSGVDPGNCTTSSTSSGEGSGIVLGATCTDAAGNTGSASYTVSVDKTAPTVGYSGNAGTYDVDQTVALTCSASDALSGVASSTCANVAGSALSFGLGTHSYSATATDNAGNTGSGSTSFTVVVTSGGLCDLVRQWVSNAGIANSLCVKLDAAAAAGARGQAKTAANIIGAFDNEVSAQSGKAISAAHAATLIALAAHL